MSAHAAVDAASRDAHVEAVIVTYGSRGRLAVDAVSSALQAGSTSVSLVCNGCDLESIGLLTDAFCSNSQVSMIVCPRNLGSSGGFGLGIQNALDFSADFVWLLDDDNRPDVNALDEALRMRIIATRQPAANDVAVLSYRLRNKRQKMRVEGTPAEEAFPQSGSFMYFDLRRKFSQRLWRSGSSNGSAPCGTNVLTVPYGPFGGLLISASTANKVGLPNADLVLYEDDTEYLDRMRRSGVDVILAPDSVIDEDDPKWANEGFGRGPARLLQAQSAAKVYYSTRNRTYFDRRSAELDGVFRWYLVNCAAYAMYLAFNGIPPHRWKRLGLVLKAIYHGHKRRLSLGPSL